MSEAYAETWADIGRLPLRRRDRAAMVLALEHCRLPDGGACVSVLLYAPGVAGVVGAEAEHANVPWRLLRARLALLLRVLLRVDAERERYGPRAVGCWWADCRRCNGSGAHSAEWMGLDCPACGGDAVELAPLVIRPLWEIRR